MKLSLNDFMDRIKFCASKRYYSINCDHIYRKSKSCDEYDSVGWDIVPIVLASYIALIMAVLRFYKWEDTKERFSNCYDNHVFISNKLIKINNSINKFDFNTMPYDEWKNLISVYENGDFVNVVTVKESFESLMRYKDLIYYKSKFRKMYLKHEIINNDIDTVTKSKHLPLNSFRRLICCPFKSSKYGEFFRKMDGLEDDKQNDELHADSQLITREPAQEYEYSTHRNIYAKKKFNRNWLKKKW